MPDITNNISKSVLHAILFILLVLPAISYAQNTCQVHLKVDNLRNTKGEVRIAVFNSDDGFPSVHEKSVFKASKSAKEAHQGFHFELPYGLYAISLIHDENGDSKMNYNLLGIPKEGFSTTRLKESILGLPSFDKAAIELKAEKVNVVLEVNYMF
jgi:uncharacterized protein (DUF2141 family)